ncbi:hypothetical protein [Streptomyces sp. FL07-04A]|uniref:hypothetical protein n=1 Tax=Streptomyces sp. FL07-04A TaxID=3028658 RepID=UPI0029AD9BA9|nr:hypothetical protein [Streptomyces sp. FL07-04A]MDX3578139.1 hypothetical protein [Streptomyces sp. FL07-04A]
MREVTRHLYQDHLRLRELTEQRIEEVVDAVGQECTRIERGRRRILSTVGASPPAVTTAARAVSTGWAGVGE